MSDTADHATIPRDAVVFVSLSRGIGGPAQSLLSVLEHLGGDHDRILYAPPGDLAFAGRAGRTEATIDMPFDVRRRRRSRIRAGIKLARFVRHNRERIVALHANGQSELNLAALAVVAGAGVPVVMWAHTSIPSPTSAALRPFWRLARRRVRWAAVSETAAHNLTDTLGIALQDITLIPNPIDPAQLVAERVPHEGVRVGYLGLAALHQGFDLLTSIWQEVRRDDVGLDLYIAPPTPTPRCRCEDRGRN